MQRNELAGEQSLGMKLQGCRGMNEGETCKCGAGMKPWCLPPVLHRPITLLAGDTAGPRHSLRQVDRQACEGSVLMWSFSDISF